MFAQIVANTPPWVWGLLLVLLTLGYSQTRARRVGLRRMLILPLVMTALSLSGTLSSFGGTPDVVLAWIAASVITVWLASSRRAPASARYDGATGLFHLPGSWAPMMLIVGIFILKYAVGVTLAMRPELARMAEFSVAFAALFGACSGVFIARAGRLWKLSRPAGAGAGVL
jgi:hypothetical protein